MDHTYPVIKRLKKQFVIDRNGHREIVSMDRLKRAIMDSVLNNPTVPKQVVLQNNNPTVSKEVPSQNINATVPQQVFLQNNNPTVSKPVLLQKYLVNIQTRFGHTVNLPLKLWTVHFRSS